MKKRVKSLGRDIEWLIKLQENTLKTNEEFPMKIPIPLIIIMNILEVFKINEKGSFHMIKQKDLFEESETNNLKVEILLSLFDDPDINYEVLTKDIIEVSMIDHKLLLKSIQTYLLKLPNPLFPYEYFEEIIKCNKEEDETKKLESIKSIIDKLSEARYRTIQFILFFLIKININNKEINFNKVYESKVHFKK
jgi:hypothetical protein